MRTAVVLLAAQFFFLASPASAGKHPRASLIVNVEEYSQARGNCTALANALTPEDWPPDVLVPDTRHTADPSWTDVLVSVFLYQPDWADPDPAAPGEPGLHAASACFGVEYDEDSLDLGWLGCADFDLTTDETPEGRWCETWPAAGSGDCALWYEVQRGQVALLGAFRVAVHHAGTISFKPHCMIGAQVQDDAAEWDAIRWGSAAGLGGAEGCNHCVTGVRPTTWGRIKARY